MSDQDAAQLLRLTADIVSAHAAKSSVADEDLPALIRSVHAALASAAAPQAPEAAAKREPAVPVKKSVFPDFIVCLEDGKKLKTLKRHLASAFQLTPDEYRTRWGLPRDYPMVAPNYAAKRSALARELGLGRKPAAPEPPPEPVQPAKRGRKKAAA